MSAFLLTPDPRNFTLSNHKLLINPIVDCSENGNLPGAPACGGYAQVDPGQSALSHVHEYSWTYIVVLAAGPEGAITQFGERMEFFVVQHPGQVLVMKPGLYHRVRNTSTTTSLSAVEFRTCKRMSDDRVLLPHLDDIDLDAATEIATESGLTLSENLPPMPTAARREAEALGTGRHR